MENKKYTIFLIDADDTLFDYKKAEQAAIEAMLKKHCINFSSALHNKYREFNAQAWAAFERGEISLEKLQTQRFEGFLAHLGLSVDCDRFNQEYLLELAKGTYLIDGALELCRTIFENGGKIYIITNGITVPQRARLAQSAISCLVSNCFISQEIGYRKPQREYFDYVFSHIPCFNKKSTLLIGDSLSADILGANNAQIDCCWLNPCQQEPSNAAKPTYIIKALKEALQFI